MKCVILAVFNATYVLTRNTIIYGVTIDIHKDLFPVGLVAQLAEHSTGIAEVRGQVRNPFRLEFSGLFRYYISSVKDCEDHVIIAAF